MNAIKLMTFAGHHKEPDLSVWILTKRVRPRQRASLTGKELSQTFMGLGPAVYLAINNVTKIFTGIIGRDSWAMLSLGTPNSISFRLKMLSAAENPKADVKSKMIMTYILGLQMILHNIL